MKRRSFLATFMASLGALVGIKTTSKASLPDGWISFNDELPPLETRVVISWVDDLRVPHVTEGMRRKLSPIAIDAMIKRGQTVWRDWYWQVSWSRENQMLAWRYCPQPLQPGTCEPYIPIYAVR